MKTFSLIFKELIEIGAASANSEILKALHQARGKQLHEETIKAADRLKAAMEKNEELRQALAAAQGSASNTSGTEAGSLAPAQDLAPTEEVVGYFSNSPVAESPLDQFEIFPLLPVKIGDSFLSFTNSSLFMLLTLGLVLLMILLVTKKGGGKLVPKAWQSVVELISHCFRALSSGIRLFANMMAGPGYRIIGFFQKKRLLRLVR
jgi:hypothetical protein